MISILENVEGRSPSLALPPSSLSPPPLSRKNTGQEMRLFKLHVPLESQVSMTFFLACTACSK